MSSWVKVSRKLLTSAIASKPEYLAVWVHLLLSASYKEGEILVGRQVVRLKPGDLVFGRHKFSEKTGVSESIVRGAMKALVDLQQITIKSHNKFSVISITNWLRYQVEQPADRQQMTSRSPTDDHNKEVLDLQEEDQKPCGPQAAPRKRVQVQYDAIKDIYNEICPPTFPACGVMNDKRKRQIKKMGEIEFMGSKPFTKGIEVWRQYFTDCLTNPHWCGKNDKDWRADFDFVIRPENAIKLMERMN